jgi:hypothetical protein
MAIKQDVNAPLIVTIGVVSGLLLLVIVFGTEAWFVGEERSEMADKWESTKHTQLEELRTTQRAMLERTGPTTIPIDRAMQKLVEIGGKLPSTQPKKK